MQSSSVVGGVVAPVAGVTSHSKMLTFQMDAIGNLMHGKCALLNSCTDHYLHIKNGVAKFALKACEEHFRI